MIREENKMKKRLHLTFNAPLVLGFALACFIVTLVRTIGGENGFTLFFSTYGFSWGKPLSYLRLFTHVLGHANMGHLVNNMAFILLLGPILEEKYSWKNLLAVILVTAVVTGLVHSLLFPHSYLLGASGVVFAFILMTSFTEFREGEIPLTFILVAVVYLGQQIYDAIAVQDNISNLSHIIGGLVGTAGGYLLNVKERRKY